MTGKGPDTPALSLYLAATIVFCTLPYALIGVSGQLGGGAGGYVTLLMWGPAAAALVTTWWCGRDWVSLGLSRWSAWSAWFGYLVPIGYAGIAYALVWALGLGGFARPEAIENLAVRLGWTITDPAAFTVLYMLFVGVTGIVRATAMGLGEEIGWRGFLTPLLVRRFGFTGGSIVIGIIWTLWHVPLIVFANYNNGTPVAFALACFFVMVMNLSFILTWLRLRSGSVWPCAILHGSHNLFIQQIFTPLTSPEGSVTAYAIDEFGFMLPAIAFIVALFLWLDRGRAMAAANHPAR